MRTDVTAERNEREGDVARTGLWIALVTVGSVLGSLAFACAAPLVALATVAGTKMRPGPGLALIALAWLANQAAGYMVLDYPITWDSFAWGSLMGIASVLGFIAALAVTRAKMPALVTIAAAFATAFVVYELTLLAGTAVLPTADGMFALPIVMEIFGINVVALVIVVALHRLAVAGRLLLPLGEARASSA